ncbi:hypothetical protein AB0F93_00585 [Micromonospora tulbaghiae]|uniref:hypothetical protein n=1 Tax=Micromonospora tulbaghiae TaxID=479978 RepID=UPI003330C901
MADDDEQHRAETCDHRYYPWELNVGWLLHSPAGRLEKVTDVDEGAGHLAYAVRVFTEDTGPDYSWRLPRHDKVHALPRHPHGHPSTEPHLLVFELSGPSGRISVVPAYRWQEIPEFRLALATARPLGPGQGWEVTDHPGGGDLVVTTHSSKAKARSAIVAAAKAHAAALKLPLREEKR